MALSHLSAQKTWSAGVSLHLHAAQLVCYSWSVADQMLFLGILLSIRSAPTGSWVLFMRTHNYGQPILVRFSAQCIQRTGLCVP